jgi:hypothetical protein
LVNDLWVEKPLLVTFALLTYLICSKQVKCILIVFSILQSFTELKEEESSLLKERIVLEKVKF